MEQILLPRCHYHFDFHPMTHQWSTVEFLQGQEGHYQGLRFHL